MADDRTSTGRGVGLRPPSASLLPDDRAPATDAHALVIRGIEAVEGSRHQLAAVEKSVDVLKVEVANVTERTAALDGYLARIAKAEEERTALAKAAAERRDEWAGKLWQSPTVQLALMTIVVGVMQLLGLRWLAEAYLPTVVGVAP